MFNEPWSSLLYEVKFRLCCSYSPSSIITTRKMHFLYLTFSIFQRKQLIKILYSHAGGGDTGAWPGGPEPGGQQGGPGDCVPLHHQHLQTGMVVS